MTGYGGVVQSFEHCPQGFEHSPKPLAKTENGVGVELRIKGSDPLIH